MIRKGHIAYQSICIVGLNTSDVFHYSSLSLSKVIDEKLLVTFPDLR